MKLFPFGTMCIMRLQYARFNNILVKIKLALVLSDCLQLHNESKIEPYRNPLKFSAAFKREPAQVAEAGWETEWLCEVGCAVLSIKGLTVRNSVTNKKISRESIGQLKCADLLGLTTLATYICGPFSILEL